MWGTLARMAPRRPTNALAFVDEGTLRGFRLVADATVAHTIEEIDGKPDYQPDAEPEPCVAGQTQHQQYGRKCSRRRYKIDSWRLEGPLDVWLRHAQREHA